MRISALDDSVDMKSVIKDSVELAEEWQKQANDIITFRERAFQKMIARLLMKPNDKVLVTRIIDQSFRSNNARRIAKQINRLLSTYGFPAFMTFLEKLFLMVFMATGERLSPLLIPVLIYGIRTGSRTVILPGEKTPLLRHLKNRKNSGVQININHLGEAVLGEDESATRLRTYTADLENPLIENISVKISTIYSQILPLDTEHTITILVERLSILYKAAMNNPYMVNQTKTPKLVNLDMEEFRDLEITAAAFMQTLDKDAFKNYSGGIVLQSYLPDSFNIQQTITEWAKKRFKNGGSPVRLRIVKGANLEMEKVHAAISNWPLATFDNKKDVDANYKRMVIYGMQPDNIQAVHLGIASHNMFELAFAYQLALRNKVTSHLSFEMLEGMADHVRRAIGSTLEKFLLYAPVSTKDQFTNAIAYLIRRLDENTAEENFLRYAYDLDVGTPSWDFLKKQFIDSCHSINDTKTMSNRTQNRLAETTATQKGTFCTGVFVNEPDTDWSLRPNREWACSIRKKWKKSRDDLPVSIPVVVGGNDIQKDRRSIPIIDRSQVDMHNTENVCVATGSLANEADVHLAVATAKQDPAGWRKLGHKTRWEILSRVAMNIRETRGDLIGAAAAGTGKVFTESDVEVSEAIDFTEYYPYSVNALTSGKNLKCIPKGVGVVIAPWNFPIAIPCGGIMAGLSAGNTMILKPASAAILPAFLMCTCFWNAGVPKEVLQFLPLDGASTGNALTTHEDVDFIIFTGSTATGLSILKARPNMVFAGETGGKNATIVTAMSDRDQAISHVIQSAFGNTGQKCSATSLLILEKEVYEDQQFKRQLVDAAKSFATGSVWDFKNRMGPLILPPEKHLKKALTELEPNEEWALKPENIENNPYLWTPGIKYNVMPGSTTHMIEFFGPVLGVMKADSLAHAVSLANQTGYGLTAGLQSLDIEEQDYWKHHINAGNLYINRGTTGAVVLRQPFGGMGKSAIGAGIKAGGPNYALQFMDIEDADTPDIASCTENHPLLQVALLWELKLANGDFQGCSADINKTILSIKSYISASQTEFSKEKDYFHLRGQDNLFRYLPVGTVLIRVQPEDSLFETLGRIAAAKIAGCAPVLSLPHNLENSITAFLNGKEGMRFLGNTKQIRQNNDEIIKMIDKIHRIRYAGPDRVPEKILTHAAATGFFIAKSSVLMEGRIELLHYMREQSVCNTYHRYGNLGERSAEFPA